MDDRSRPARFTAQSLKPSPTGLGDATTTLRHFAILTWATAPEALAAHLPPGFEPDVFTMDDGSSAALISAVPFEDVDMRFHFAPFYKVAMGQTNYRAYVRYRGQRAVWFFGTTLTGPWRFVPAALWRLPWHKATMRFEVSWQAPTPTYALTTQSEWAPMQLRMRGQGQPMGRLDGFLDEEDTAVILTHPLVGYYTRRDGKLGSYQVWHDRLELERAQVEQASAPLFERLGLITAQTPPHSALMMRQTEFIIYLPPRVVAAG